MYKTHVGNVKIHEGKKEGWKDPDKRDTNKHWMHKFYSTIDFSYNNSVKSLHFMGSSFLGFSEYFYSQIENLIKIEKIYTSLQRNQKYETTRNCTILVFHENWSQRILMIQH